METFLELYESRKKEISDILSLLGFLERKQRTKVKDEDVTEFDSFFHSVDGIDLSYQSMTNILKSNVALMIYNLIEFTITNIIEYIYEQIRVNQLGYTGVNELIQKLWHMTVLRATNDPGSNFNTVVKTSEKVINVILDNSVIQLKSRDTLPAGNLGGAGIKDTLSKHGILINTSSPNFRPDILDTIKEKRNELAHGSVSFVEAMRDYSIIDIIKINKLLIDFLQEVIDTARTYLDEQQYKSA